LSSLLEVLTKAVGCDRVVAGRELDQATSYWDSTPAQALALVRPENAREVSDILIACAKHGHPVVTQGGKTNCVQSADARANEVILSTERLNKIHAIDTVGGTVVVGAGVVLQQLPEYCLQHEMIFPLDLGARGSCTIGGNVATNAGGVNVLRYGMMRNLVLGMEVVLADGTVLSSMNQMLKNNTAYDLKQLFIGSEGTLGIVTQVVLRLFPKPRSCETALMSFASFDAVTHLLGDAQRQLGGTLSAYEVMWGDYYRGVTESNGHRAPLDRDQAYYVLIEAEGGDPDVDRVRFEQLLNSALQAGEILDAVVAKSEADRRGLWKVREDFEPILESGPCFLYDVSLPIIAMAEYVDQISKELCEQWPACELYLLGHIADGNLHFFIRTNADGENLHHQCDAILYEALSRFHGAISAEHGIGIEKMPWLSQSRSKEEIEVMKAIKRTMDPGNLLNPARVFEV
jgi:FAD/FMN-containing dehydrogenase